MATLSINDALTRMLKLNNNSLTILSKLTESLTTTDQDYINVELWNADTTSKTTYKIPSYSFLQIYVLRDLHYYQLKYYNLLLR